MFGRSEESQAVQLGDEVIDRITGFAGTVTSRSTYLYGCVRCLVEGKGGDGEPKEFYIDEQRLDVTGKLDRAPERDPEPAATSGGPQSRQGATTDRPAVSAIALKLVAELALAWSSGFLLAVAVVGAGWLWITRGGPPGPT